jgi:hypothetical protein
MFEHWYLRNLFLVASLCGVASGVAQATDPLPATSSLVASSGAAAPTQSSFTINGPQDLVVTLMDLQNPAALSSLSVAVTQSGQLAADYTLSASTTSTTIMAANGTYTISVFGVPDANSGAGTFSVCVAPSSAPTNCLLPGTPSLSGGVASFAGTISAQSAAQNPTLSTSTFMLAVPSPGGSYTVNFADLGFPAALSSSSSLNPNPNLGLFLGSQPVAGGLGFSSGTSFNLSPGTYTLLAVAQADATAKAGSYGITVSGPAGSAPLLAVTVPVGQLGTPDTVINPSQQSVTLTVTDYAFPGPLTKAAAMLTFGGTSLINATATGGPVTTVVPKESLQLWTYAAPGTTAGTYGIDVSAGGSDLYLDARGVASSSTSYAFAFVTPALTPNTAYQAAAVDLAFPAALSSLSFAAVHDGIVTTESNGAASFTPTDSRPAVVLVAASTPASGSLSASGLFDVSVQTTGSSPQLVFDQTQAVSSLPGFFQTQSLSFDTAGTYNASLTDLLFPASFASLGLAVTQGGQVVGKIFGGGTFSFPATPGTYRLSFVATPQTSQSFGMYGVSVLYSAPTVTLTASSSSAVTGSSVTLNYTTTNATSCTASGGSFTGSITPDMTSSQSVTLSATTTYMLSCTGPKGTASQSVTVTATAPPPPPASGGHGGGALDGRWLTIWSVLVVATVWRRWRESRLRAAA